MFLPIFLDSILDTFILVVVRKVAPFPIPHVEHISDTCFDGPVKLLIIKLLVVYNLPLLISVGARLHENLLFFLCLYNIVSGLCGHNTLLSMKCKFAQKVLKL